MNILKESGEMLYPEQEKSKQNLIPKSRGVHKWNPMSDTGTKIGMLKILPQLLHDSEGR